MKRILSFALCVLLVMGLFGGCGSNGQTDAGDVKVSDAIVNKDGVLKVLAIGNSFSQDATHLLAEIAKQEGTEIVLGNLVRGACSLATHASNTVSNAAAYSFFKSNGGEWNVQKESTMLDGITSEDWDVITLQQVSDASGKVGTYNHDIQTVVNYVNSNKTNPDAIMLWHMTWAYPQPAGSQPYKYYKDQTTMYTSIVGAVQEKILTDKAFSGVLPSGTAIQNVRTSYLGDTLNRDSMHLNDLGRVIAAYTWYCVLTGKTLDTIALDAVPEALTESYEGTGDMVLTEGQKLVIAEAVKNALANPFAVTQSQYTAEPSQA